MGLADNPPCPSEYFVRSISPETDDASILRFRKDLLSWAQRFIVVTINKKQIIRFFML